MTGLSLIFCLAPGTVSGAAAITVFVSILNELAKFAHTYRILALVKH